MAAPDPGVRLEAIREAARLATAAKSLRGTAREIGLSPMGLRHFLNGRRPYQATMRKLTIWYVRHGSQRGADTEVIRAAMSLVLEGLPAEGHEPGEQALLAVVEQMHRRAGTRPPTWLDDLREGDGADS